jgi:hypothetical protein
MARISQPSRSAYPGNGFMPAIEQGKVMSRHRMRDQAGDSDANDLVQEVLLAVSKDLSKFERRGQLRRRLHDTVS